MPAVAYCFWLIMKEFMNYEFFTERMLEEVKKGLGEGYDTELLKIPQINDGFHDGLRVKKGGVNMSPMFVMNQYFELYDRGYMDFNNIVKRVLEKYKLGGDITEAEADGETCFDDVRKRIVFRLINRSLNEQFLIETPFIEYLDFAIVFYIIDEKDPYAEALVRERHLAGWGVTKEDLMLLAKENTPRLYGAQISTLHDEINDLEVSPGFRADKPEIPYESKIFKSNFYVLSNSVKRYGAACILYEGVLKDFAEQLESDLILFPLSIHKFLLVPTNHYPECEELYMQKKVLDSTIIDFVQDENQLSEEVFVYLYRRQTDIIEPVWCGPFN